MYDALKKYFQEKIPGMTDAQFEELKKLFVPRSIPKGEIFLRAGEICRYGAFVVKGCLRAYVIDDKGKEHIIQFAPENWWIADQNSLVRQEPAMFFIDAIEDTEALLFNELFGEKFEAAMPGIRSMSQALLQNSFRAMQRRLVNHLSATANERYLDFLRSYPDMVLRLPQHMIASYIGVAPESLSRIRKEIAKG